MSLDEKNRISHRHRAMSPMRLLLVDLIGRGDWPADGPPAPDR